MNIRVIDRVMNHDFVLVETVDSIETVLRTYIGNKQDCLDTSGFVRGGHVKH